MDLKSIFRGLESFEPSLKEGTDQRVKLAAELAAKDAPILGRDQAELNRLYETFLLHIVTDKLLEEVVNLPAQKRWALVEPLREPTPEQSPCHTPNITKRKGRPCP